MVSSIDANQLEQFIKENPSWSKNENTIRKNYEFENFIEAFGFISKVAILSEKMDHHPNLQNTYNKVTIELTTHDTGGISIKDLKLAAAIDKLMVN